MISRERLVILLKISGQLASQGAKDFVAGDQSGVEGKLEEPARKYLYRFISFKSGMPEGFLHS